MEFNWQEVIEKLHDGGSFYPTLWEKIVKLKPFILATDFYAVGITKDDGKVLIFSEGEFVYAE